MGKAILISINPEWVCKILNGEKIVEIRKAAPKCGLPIDVYVYCTKAGNKVGKYGDGEYHEMADDSHWACGCSWNLPTHYLNGKVVAKFKLRFVDRIYSYGTDKLDTELGSSLEELSFESRVPEKDLLSYVGDGAFCWVISDLEILDEPMELSEFYTLKCKQKKSPCNIKDVFGVEECREICKLCKPLAKAPRSWCYVEEHEWWEL